MGFHRGIIASAVGTPPTAPTNVDAVPYSGYFDLTWTVPDGGGLTITDYAIQYSDNNGATWTLLNDGVSTNNYALVNGLTVGSTYIFQVAAISAGGQGDWSVPSDPAVFGTVPAQVGTPSVAASNGAVTVSWSAPAANGYAISDYVVEYRDTSTGTWYAFGDGISATTSTVVTGLTVGATYVFRVSAVNQLGTGPASNQSSSVVFGTVPSQVGTPTVSAGDRSFTVSWSAPSANGYAITQYVVETQRNSEAWVDRGVQSSGVVFTFRNDGASYRARVTAYNALGAGLTSPESAYAAPTFPAQAAPSITVTSSPSTLSPGTRYYNVTADPVNCSAFWYANIYINGVSQGNVDSSVRVYADRVGSPNETVTAYVQTFNTDGDSVISATTSLTLADWSYISDFSDTGDVRVDGQNTLSVGGVNQGNDYTYAFSKTADQNVTSIVVRARTGVRGTGSTYNITSSNRFFILTFSGTNSTFDVGDATYSGNQAPFSTTYSTTNISETWGVANTGYENAGSGRVRITAEGTIGTFSTSNPDQRIWVSLRFNYTQRY